MLAPMDEWKETPEACVEGARPWARWEQLLQGAQRRVSGGAGRGGGGRRMAPALAGRKQAAAPGCSQGLFCPGCK